MAVRRSIYFDSSRACGPLDDEDWCEHGKKWVQFHSKTSSGYDFGMHLSALDWAEPDMKHVIAIELTGMQQDYGYNAIAVVMDAYDPNGTKDMLPLPHNHTLSLESQFECAWPNTRFTLVIDPTNAKILTYIEPCDECPKETWSHPLGKRKRAEAEEDYKPGLDALPYSHKPSDWTDLGGGLKVRTHDAAWLKTAGAPNLGVRMCGGYDNRATIVAPSSCVLAASAIAVGGDERLIVYS